LTDETEAGAADARSETPPRSDDSVRGSVERLVAAGRELAEAELAWARLKGRSVARVVRTGLLLAIVALVCLIVGLSLLLVAAIVALAPLTGLLAAVLIVCAGSLAGAALFGLLARNAFLRMIGDDAP
jgi:hypothetical protein